MAYFRTAHFRMAYFRMVHMRYHSSACISTRVTLICGRTAVVLSYVLLRKSVWQLLSFLFQDVECSVRQSNLSAASLLNLREPSVMLFRCGKTVFPSCLRLHRQKSRWNRSMHSLVCSQISFDW